MPAVEERLKHFHPSEQQPKQEPDDPFSSLSSILPPSVVSTSASTSDTSLSSTSDIMDGPPIFLGKSQEFEYCPDLERELQEKQEEQDNRDPFSARFTDDEMIQPDELIFLQLPSMFPLYHKKHHRSSHDGSGGGASSSSSSKSSSTKSSSSKSSASKSHSSTLLAPDPEPPKPMSKLRRLPPGVIGELSILKSGKMVLQMGSVQLNVTPGVDSLCLQHLLAINADTAFALGDIRKRVICTPDVEYFIDSTSS